MAGKTKKPQATVTSAAKALIVLENNIYRGRHEKKALIELVLAEGQPGQVAELIKKSFTKTHYPRLGAEQLALAAEIACRASAPEVMPILVAVPTEETHAPLRMKLLERVLKRPQQEVLTSEWYRGQFRQAKFLPAEIEVLFRYVGTMVSLDEYLGFRKPVPRGDNVVPMGKKKARDTLGSGAHR